MDNDLWSGFWRGIFFLLLVAAIVSSCSGCAGKELTVNQVITAIRIACGDGGVKDIEFDNDDEPRVRKGSCYQERIIIAR